MFGFYCNFTGQTIIDDWFITLFNLLFTSLPLGARALLDHDIKPEDGEVIKLMLPFLYLENREKPIFTVQNFFIGLTKGVCHSLINFFWVIYMMDESIDKEGKMGGLWFCSVNLFTNILVIVTLELLIRTKYHTWINLVIILVITFLAYIIFLIIVQNLTMFNSVGTVGTAFNSGKMWLNIFFVGGTCAMIDFFLISFEFIFWPNLTRKLQVMVNQKMNLNSHNSENMPKIVKEKLSFYNQFAPGEQIIQEAQNNIGENNINNKEIQAKNDLSQSNLQIKVETKKNMNKGNECSNEKNEKRNIITEDGDNVKKKTDNEVDSNKLKSTNKTEIFVLKQQNVVEVKKEEDIISKDHLINEERDDNQKTIINK